MNTAQAVDAAMRRNGPLNPDVAAHDVEAIARIVVRHWGDQAPHILKEAEKRANETIAQWGAKGTETES